VINFNSGDITLTHSTDALTLGGGSLQLGINNLGLTGSIGLTGSRVTKGWFTDLEVTNAPTINGTSLATTLSGKVNVSDTAAMLLKYLRKSGVDHMKIINTNEVALFNAAGDTLDPYTSFSNRAGITDLVQPATLGMTADTIVTFHNEGLYSIANSILNISEGVNRLVDTTHLITFERGSGLRGSQSMFLLNASLGSFYNGGSDTLVITEARGVVVQDSGTVTTGVQVYYDANHFDGTPTSIFSATADITSTTSGNVIVTGAGTPHLEVQKIPPSNWIWGRVVTKSNGNMPAYLSLTLSGFKIRGESAGAAPGFLTIDGHTVGWYDSQNLTTITKDGSELVAQWNDKLGSGHNLLQSEGSNKPVWSTSGILFDGADDWMKTGSFTLDQPIFIYIVFKNVTNTQYDWIFDGYTGDKVTLIQDGGTEYNLMANAGTYSALATMTNNTFGIVRVLFYGASSKLQVNEDTPITSNFGANNMGGFTLGMNAWGQKWANIQVKEIIIRNVSDSSGDEDAIYTYLKNKYGL
jgi:hypothetical protein